MFIIIVFWLGIVWPRDFFFRARFASFNTHVFFLIVFCFFIISFFTVPMRECLGKHSCMSSPFLIAILNGTFFFREKRNV